MMFKHLLSFLLRWKQEEGKGGWNQVKQLQKAVRLSWQKLSSSSYG